MSDDHTAQAVGAYATVRSLEEQLRIAEENVKIQQRSFDIAQVLYDNGADSELDGWEGCDEDYGEDGCLVIMTGDRVVTADFE